jgi:hypothetical protein
MWSRAVAVFLLLQSSSGRIATGHSAAVDPSSARLTTDLVIGVDQDDVVLGRIVDVAVDSQDNIYALDASVEAIHRFSPEGRYLGSFGGHGEGPGEFDAPGCFAIGMDDRVYVAGFGLNIEVLHTNGIPTDRIKRATTSPARSIAVDDNGDIYVVEVDIIDQKMIHKYSGQSHKLVKAFCDTYAVGHDVDTREESIFALGAVAVENDRVYYVQSYPHKIRTFDLSGVLVQEFDARVDESKAPRRRLGASGVQYQVPASFSRTIVPLDGDRLLTILGLPFEGSDGTSYLDIYDRSNGARMASITNPGTVDICCHDRTGRLYSTEVRDDLPVVVRYLLR